MTAAEASGASQFLPNPAALKNHPLMQIHTSKMVQNSFIGRDVDLAALAGRLQHYEIL